MAICRNSMRSCSTSAGPGAVILMEGSALREGIEICLAQWPAMQLVRAYQPEPEQALATFAQEIENYIHQFEVDVDYMVDWLSDYLDKNYSIDVDDGSLDIVAQTLLKIYTEEGEGRYDELDKIRKLRTVQLPQLTKVKLPSSDSIPLSSLSLAESPASAAPQEPQTDEQGFTVVSKKPRRKGQ